MGNRPLAVVCTYALYVQGHRSKALCGSYDHGVAYNLKKAEIDTNVISFVYLLPKPFV